MQRADRPEAYEPEIVTQQRRKEAIHREKQEFLMHEEELKNQIEKTLFDFDDEIDQLS